jgi:hypothetical protein
MTSVRKEELEIEARIKAKQDADTARAAQAEIKAREEAELSQRNLLKGK